MTRDEQLVFCKKCNNRKLDLEQGLICSLTGEKANFTNTCAEFIQDQAVLLNLDDQQPLENNKIRTSLSFNAFEKLRFEQNYPLAVFSGLAAGMVGALLWGFITVVTNFQIGFMALAVGAGVGYTMRYYGEGIDQIFGVTGAIIAVLSCALGNFLSIMSFIADSEGLGYVDTLILFDYAYLLPVMAETFSMMDLLFYGIAGYEGYKFSFRVLTEKDLGKLENS